MRKGQKMTQEQKDKISKAHLGMTFSDEHRKNLSLSHLGHIPTNLAQLIASAKGRVCKPETKLKLRLAQIGKPKNMSAEARKRISDASKNRKVWNAGTAKIYHIKCVNCLTLFDANSSKRKFCSIGCYRAYNKGVNNYKWIEDRSKIVGRHNRDAHDPDTKQWRRKVFERDYYKCQLSDIKCAGKIEAHHIKRWKDFPLLRYEVGNGITLCHYHHPRKKKEEQLLEITFRNLIDNHK